MIGNRLNLSGSTNGRPIKLVAIASPGTLIHTAVTGTVSFDEVYLWCSNSDIADNFLTVEFGGTTNPDDRILNTYLIPANSTPILVVPGISLCNGLIVRAYCPTANVLLISGHINRLS